MKIYPDDKRKYESTRHIQLVKQFLSTVFDNAYKHLINKILFIQRFYVKLLNLTLSLV